MSLETDGQTRSNPENRVVWFEAEDRITEEVKRMVDSEIGDVERTPQDVQVAQIVRFFVSYAHKDASLKDKLLESLTICLDTHPQVHFEIWTDGDILPGKQWRAEIQKAMEACDFGLLLVSPAFLASRFITAKELPYFLEKKQIVPVGLKTVLFDGNMDLKGLEERQLFLDDRRQPFIDQTTKRTQDRFALQLFRAISKLLAAEPRPTIPEHPRHKLDELHAAVADFDPTRFVPTEGVPTTISRDLEGTPEIDPRRRKDALQFLIKWVTDEKAPPYCALLGEYGMGKTTTCKALARELLNRHEKGKKVPLPIYLDLRNVGVAARRGLVLEEILELILRNSWKIGPGTTSLNARELINLVQQQGALVIWDGLDEVLVHLDPDPGQKFTRQLFRILPPARQSEMRRGRMLISCRTHYFRTLRDQQNHFRAEDRDNVRKEDYQSPFVLLPFTTEQIRQYLEHSLPDEDPERVMEVLGTVHNLTEMAERPYTLSLIAEHFAQIERWKAEGRRVTGLMLYRHMVLSWLERDQGKHQFTTDHKQALMEYFAAELWQAGARFWSVGDLEQWMVNFLEKHTDLAAHYKNKDRELLKEDLRTATFLVREGEDRFRFAHTSLQEFFLAGYLRRALVERRPEAWRLPRVSTETLEFLGQWLHEEDSHRRAALATLESLRDVYRSRASEMAFAYFLLATRKGYPAPSPAGFQLPGADLTEWEIKGDAGSPLMLEKINLLGARLWNSRWRYCNLDGAIFDSADALRAEWLQCHLARSIWRGAQLEATMYRDCEMEGAGFQEAICQRASWLRCRLEHSAGLPLGPPEALYALCQGDLSHASGKPAMSARLQVATGHQNHVLGCAWSPDGRRILSSSADNTLRIWDASSGQTLVTFFGHQNYVWSCAWSPDGRRILSSSADNTLRIWDASSGQTLATLSGHESSVRACAWSPDGRRVLSASTDRTLRIWDANSGLPLATLSGHESSVRACAWSPDGRRILSASTDRTLRIWDVNSGQTFAILSSHQSSVLGCAWSPNGQRILSASADKTLRIWDANSGQTLATLSGHESFALGCAWSPDGRRILSSSDDNTLRIWDANSAQTLASLTGHKDSVWSCAWSPDSLRILSASNDNILRIWDASSAQTLASLTGHERHSQGCAWSPDGRRILSAFDDKTLRIWDARSGNMLTTLIGHEHYVLRCAWSPDGRRVVSSSHDETLRIWDAQSGLSLSTLTSHERSVWGCAWSPDGQRILSSSDDSTLRIWDANSGKCLATLRGHDGFVRACSWSPDGRLILSGCDQDHALLIWDANSGKVLSILSAHKHSVMDCAWSSDGRRILSASADKSLRIWDVESRQILVILEGHKSFVSGCAWSPDGRRILSSSHDKTLRIWDAQSGDSLAALSGHEDSVYGCAWSPDGQRILSYSRDGTQRLWDSNSGGQLAPRIHHLKAPRGGPSWCSINPQNNRILACGAEAWRSLGWVVPDATGLPEMLPAETFGPLPTADPEN
ncbi:MAG: TIR domain-containing protein [Acidobacteriia bacterium]|nr:TIR domain-containing protein [Terriglobia bacterium]